MTKRRPCPPPRQWAPVDPSAVYQCHSTGEVGTGKATTQHLDDPAAQAFYDAAPARERGFLVYEGAPLVEHWSRYTITVCKKCGQRYWQDWDGHNPLDKDAPRRAFREVRGQLDLLGCHVVGGALALAGDCGPQPGDVILLDEPSAVAMTLVCVLLVIVLGWCLDLEVGDGA